MKNRILENIALNSIKISSNGRDISFELLNTYDGNMTSLLSCKNVFYFDYQNSLDDFDGFASYIIEIYTEQLDMEDAKKRLHDRKYSFLEPGTNDISIPNKKYYHIYFDSNESIVDVFCESYDLESCD